MRFTTSVAFAVLLFITAPAEAGPIQAYSSESFARAKAAGLPILIDVHATWCPTCRAQDPIILELSRDPSFEDLVILKLDFDSQVNERRALGVSQQSTLVVYRGKAERGRGTGVTDREQIRALAATALK
jgi:thioredoxin 1